MQGLVARVEVEEEEALGVLLGETPAEARELRGGLRPFGVFLLLPFKSIRHISLFEF